MNSEHPYEIGEEKSLGDFAKESLELTLEDVLSAVEEAITTLSEGKKVA